MITDEVLKKLADGLHPKLCGDPKYEDGEVEPVITDMASELLLLREQKRKLVEDAVELAASLRNIKLMFVRIEVDSDKKYVKQMDNALDLHNALMKEVE